MPVIAVDWSGALHGARRHIWLAEAIDGELVRLECGRTREELIAEVVAEGDRAPDLIVGLDFAFSFPAWWLAARALPDAPALWTHAAEAGERWLAECAPPFWGRPGRARTLPPERRFRRTERDVPRTGGIAPKSVFQVGGAGAVGTGSIRGMKALATLRDAGFRIWPFDAPDPHAPLAVEIWPRLLTGPVVKTRFSSRAQFLRYRFPSMPADLGVLASSSDDAFDAAVSAMVMAEHVEALRALPAARDEIERVEGAIWMPPGQPA